MSETADADEERRKLHAETRADLLKRQLSNAENYDKAILTLSAAALGFSLAVLKDIVPLATAKYLPLLYASWAFLALSLVATLASYITSQVAIAEALRRAEQYYLRGLQVAGKPSKSAKMTDVVNVVSGGLCMLGIMLSTVFVFLNVREARQMNADESSKTSHLREGAPVPPFQGPDTLKRGAPVPDFQPAPTTTRPTEPPVTPAPAPAPASTGEGGSAGAGDKKP
jgi:hypothetical protein